MGRGKIEIKRIENATNRQVTYSKRRSGIFKKAHELSVLCDAEVALIIVSCTSKVTEYITPTTTAKKIFDKYQEVEKVDLWASHYEDLQKNLNHQKEVNKKLSKEIRQRKGEDLNELSLRELRCLQQSLDISLQTVRDRKFHVLSTQTETYRKKIRSLQEAIKNNLRIAEQRSEESHYVGPDNEDDDHYATLSITRLSNCGGSGGGSRISYHLKPSQPNLQNAGGEGYSSYNLSFA